MVELLAFLFLLVLATLPFVAGVRLAHPDQYPTHRWVYFVGFVTGLLVLVCLCVWAVFAIATLRTQRRGHGS
jgi:hypothetical protein